MKGIVGLFWIGLIIVLASGLVVATKAPSYPELVVFYDRGTDSPLFASWEESMSAGVGFTSDEKGDKTTYKVKLFTTSGIFSKFTVKANEYIEDNAKVRAYKITTMNYDGMTSKESVKKIQVFSKGHMIFQRYIDVPTQEVAKEIRYDDDTEKSIIFERVNGKLKMTGTYPGFATLKMHTENGAIHAYIEPPMSE